jgi:hypothetical protein
VASAATINPGSGPSNRTATAQPTAIVNSLRRTRARCRKVGRSRRVITALATRPASAAEGMAARSPVANTATIAAVTAATSAGTWVRAPAAASAAVRDALAPTGMDPKRAAATLLIP